MLNEVIEHLRAVGLVVEIIPGATGFISGVRIVSGSLHVDPMCPPSGLLHEAGHLAIVPARFRAFMDDNLEVGIKRMFMEIDAMGLEPDHPLQRAAMQCSDPEATAWAWAAGLAAGLAPEAIILDSEYCGAGAEIRAMLMAGQYMGINGLAHAGMCKRGPRVDASDRYPVMQHWLQTA